MSIPQEPIRIYNSLHRKLEEFKPLRPGHVTMYVCGPTVYNFLHVGNFRGPVFFNLVRNFFELRNYKVTYALNFTDVDDKIIDRANQESVGSLEISERFIAEYKKDFASIGLRPHDHNPKVTDYMDAIVQMIAMLIENNKAYAVQKASDAESRADVWYSIESFSDYGKLSGRKPDELLTGVRIEVESGKRNPLDFALWKSAKPGEPSWPSPWGNGRPGWHIECSAMVDSLFGSQIDIHGGGTDLIFPHHENEIAQSEGCSHKNFVSYWMHVGMLNFSGQKMSKSLGNFVTMRDFLKQHHSEVYKWMLLSVHYRSQAEFGEEAVHRAHASLGRIYSALSLAESFAKADGEIVIDEKYEIYLQEQWSQVDKALADDFGTPQAMAALFDVIRDFNSKMKRGQKCTPQLKGRAVAFKGWVLKLGKLFSLFQEEADSFLRNMDDQLLQQKKLLRADVDQLVQKRAQARESKDFAKSDEYRAQLTAMGIVVMDTPQGSFWEVSKT